ncbi:DNA helicase/exodeoxyribonuclease V, subunit A [Amphibacillus marinus]|uniref:ATP-dependent helicase/nuclease subunit A n=1 Tax=Amphibacillus marinus TaxID=872970 RepID=A0A1H8RWX1_9BACI|nr:helicase-exonuclease AddAB subunit AddA [Amphibacillus marinus]SEO70423.1 DNA helicase/exodeoxyribonuclease V, subunit A [Amphibacillus marinus]
MPKWTAQQEEAIYTAGEDTLVAAAAGSGKTAVLVERIIQKVLDDQQPINIDQLLVVTFTNAAAQEMRNRVAQALERALNDKPESKHLKKQITLLQQASISTLHSFCLELIKRNSYLLDIDPGFRIADDIEADLLRQEVLDTLFEEWYGQALDDQEAFYSVIDRFSSDRSDQDVEALVLKLYNFSMQNASPARWLAQIVAQYNVTAPIQEQEIPWLILLKQHVEEQLHATIAEVERGLIIANAYDGPYHYVEALEQDQALALALIAELNKGWDMAQQAFLELNFKALSRKKVDCDEGKKEQVKTIRNRVKKRLTEIKDQLYMRSLDAHLTDMRELYQPIKQLAELVNQFHTSYQKIKKEKGLVDFTDLEHFAIQILSNQISDNKEYLPSTIALALREKYTEVLVDEYQDTNMVQETILQLISKEKPGNLFMVGDVKQSIYRFRHAEPALFIDKYKKFSNQEIQGKRIDLAKNFRSREQVLTATNFIFKQLMDERLGEINYDHDAALIYGNLTYDQADKSDPEAELIIIDRADGAPNAEASESITHEGETDLAKAEIEGRAYAKQIKQWIGHDTSNPTQIFDKDTGVSRQVQYRDIVILLRSMSWTPVIMEELKKQGIPVYAELASGYLAAIEIQIMLSLLKIIDNAKQDIPLASVLKSPIVGLNEEELAQIRIVNKKDSYYQALLTYNSSGSNSALQYKINQFLKQLNKWREQARQGSLSDLIWLIYRETGYYDFVAGMPGGRQRQANLRALYDRARGYEQTSFRGLFRFLRMIERMEERGEDLGAARALGESEDVVRITTIHKSKGLEYPIVILGALGKVFNQQDLRQRYLLHKDLGFGSRYIDPIKRIMYPTLMFQSIKHRLQRELWAEEMRVLYVAMTRAKEKLVMIGTVNNFEKKQEKWQELLEHNDWIIPVAARLEASSYLDWLGTSLIRHRHGTVLRGKQGITSLTPDIADDVSQWKVTIDNASDYHLKQEAGQEVRLDLQAIITGEQSVPLSDSKLDEHVEGRLSYHYPYQEATSYRAKQSVTEIKRQKEHLDENSGNEMIAQLIPHISERPRFMQSSRALTAAEIGTAMHTVMQHIPLEQEWSQQTIKNFVASLVNREILSTDQADAIDLALIADFFASKLVTLVKQAVRIDREVPFSLMLPANQIYPSWQTAEDDQIFVQGVIDLLIKTDEGWYIIDYKTDQVASKVNDHEKLRLKEKYTTQINLYQTAIEQILKIKVKQSFLYFFNQSFYISL